MKFTVKTSGAAAWREDPGTSAELPQALETENLEVPFEAPARRQARTGAFVQHLRRRRGKPLSETAVGIFLAIYAFGLYAVGFMDPGFLLFSWLMTGPLAVTVYLTFDGRGSLLNPFTLFFAAVVLGSFAAYFLSGSRHSL